MKKRGHFRRRCKPTRRWDRRAQSCVSGQAAPVVSGEYWELCLGKRVSERMGLTLSTSGNVPSSPLKFYLTQTLLLCHTRLPPKVTILSLVDHLRLRLPSAAMNGPPMDRGVWSDSSCSHSSSSHPWPWEFLHALLASASSSVKALQGSCEDWMR